MTRVGTVVAGRKRRKKIIKLAKGQRGGRSKLYRTARESVQRSLVYSYESRRLKKRTFRNLWIARINAACKSYGINYSSFMHGLKQANIAIDRKMLADIAVCDTTAFSTLVELAQKA